MLVSWRQARRSGASRCPVGRGRSGSGAVESGAASGPAVTVTQTAVSKPEIQPRTSAIAVSHSPDSRSSPTTMSSAPPTRMTVV